MFFSWWGIMITQAQESFTYQAITRNSDGEIVTSRTVSFRFSILMGGVSGTLVYAETHSAKTDEHGMVTLNIGEGTCETGDFTTIPWNSGNFFLKTEVDITGDTAFIDVGTIQI